MLVCEDDVACGVELCCFGLLDLVVGGSLNIPDQYGFFALGLLLVGDTMITVEDLTSKWLQVVVTHLFALPQVFW